MTLNLESTPSNKGNYVAELKKLHSQILNTNYEFEQMYKKTEGLALRFITLRHSCPTLNSEDVALALRDLVAIKDHSDKLLLQFGTKIYQYLFCVQGTAHRLSLAIYPQSLEARRDFLKRIYVASTDQTPIQEKIPELVDVL